MSATQISQPTVYGPHWSAYTRTVRLVLHEKLVRYKLAEVDFSSGQMPQEHLARHPFAKVPVLDHQGFTLYETTAICRYVDTEFPGPPLQPTSAQAIGRMAQIIAILDNYLSHEIRMGYFNERVIKPLMGMPPDVTRLAQARMAIPQGLVALANCQFGSGDYLVGNNISLADLHAAPLFDFLYTTDEGKSFINNQPALAAWWDAMAARESMDETAIDLEVFWQPTVEP